MPRRRIDNAALRLGNKPASFYLERFDEHALKVVGESREACTRVGEGPFEFDLCVPVEFGAVRIDLIPTARAVLSQIVDMDDAARAVPRGQQDIEELAAVVVREFFVELIYWSTTQNADRREYFTRDDDGRWRLRGLELPWMTWVYKQKAPIMTLDVAYDIASAAAAGVYFSDWDTATADGAFSTRVESEPHAYEPGEFYKRELPVLMKLLDQSPVPVSALIIDGYVWLSADSRPGLGARLYEALARHVPVIGVAKTKFHEDTWSQPIRRGASEAPLHVTAAGMDRTDAARRIERMSGDGRIPVLLKQADGLARKALA